MFGRGYDHFNQGAHILTKPICGLRSYVCMRIIDLVINPNSYFIVKYKPTFLYLNSFNNTQNVTTINGLVLGSSRKI